MGREGYLKLYRKMMDNPIVTKDAEHLAIWIFLLTEARYMPEDSLFGGKKITLQPGQLTTGRKQIADKIRVTESKVQRVLKLFESEQLIEQQTSSRNRLISIVNWNVYQSDEQPNKQQVNNNRTTSEQQVNTPKEVKNKRIKEKEIYKEKEKVDLSEFSIPIQTVIQEWLTYKEERNEAYKPTGLRSWIGQVRNTLKVYEDKHVVDVIQKTMASQYKGVVWDWLKDSPKKGKYKEYREEVKVADTLSAEEQAENIKRMQETLGGMFK